MFSSIVNLNCYGNLHPRFILIAWRWFNLPFWKCVISNPPKGRPGKTNELFSSPA
ncbi:Uncharacterised protein [Vibrio anguillarum]|nr:Uncharacterised protein [Vibrio anguillarum]